MGAVITLKHTLVNLVKILEVGKQDTSEELMFQLMFQFPHKTIKHVNLLYGLDRRVCLLAQSSREMRYLSFDTTYTLFVSSHKVSMIELCDIRTLINLISMGANHWNFPKSI